MMKKCDCYHNEQYYSNGVLIDVRQECWGTKERDLCSCGGDRTKCNFYPEVREKTLKEIEPKFGEWVSIKDRLPEKFIDVLCLYPSKNYGSNVEVDYMESDNGYFAEQFKYGAPTHWMPLPQPSKGE